MKSSIVIAILILCNVYIYAQDVVPKTTLGNVVNHKNYDILHLYNQEMDSTSLRANMGSVQRYYQSVQINLSKGEHVYFNLRSIYGMLLILRNKTNGVDSIFYKEKEKIYGTTLQRYYEVPASAMYELYIVNYDTYNSVSYDLTVLSDRTYNTPIEKGAGICERLQILKDYSYINFEPLKTNTLLKEQDDIFGTRKDYLSTAQLVDNKNLAYVENTSPRFLQGTIFEVENYNRALDYFQKIKKEITACYSGNEKYQMKETKDKYNNNLPMLEVFLEKSKYITDREFYINIYKISSTNTYEVVFTTDFH